MGNNLFNVTFESNKLYNPNSDGFDFVMSNGGDIKLSSGSVAYQGSYGCEITPLQNYRCAGAERIPVTTRFRQAFYLHPNAITIPTTRTICISRNYYSDEQNGLYWIRLNNIAGVYGIECNADDNSSSQAYGSGTFNLDNQTNWNLIESEWYSDNASGFFKLWINGTLKWNRTLVNGNLRVVFPCIGAMRQQYAISGTLYIDYWRANNDGSLIGA